MAWRKLTAWTLAAGVIIASCSGDDDSDGADPGGTSGEPSAGRAGEAGGGADEVAGAGPHGTNGGAPGGSNQGDAGAGGASGPPIAGASTDLGGAGGSPDRALGGNPSDASGAGGVAEPPGGSPATLGGAPTGDGGAGGNASAEHCESLVVDEDETGVDCGGAKCPACVPCSPSFPFESEFVVDVQYAVWTWAYKTCKDSMAQFHKTSRVRLGPTADDLTVDGEAVEGYQSSTTSGPVTTYTYRFSDPSGGPCPFIGYLDQPGLANYLLRLSVNADTGQIVVAQECVDGSGHCLSVGQGYQDSYLDGVGYNSCL